MQQNKGILRGTLKDGLTFDYEREGEVFYKGTLLVSRLSKALDEIPLIVPEKIIGKFYDYDEVTLEGSFRSRNRLVAGKSTLQLYFFVDKVTDEVPENTNYLYLEGYICREPIYRLTPFNKEICDLLVAVNRNTKRSDYLPCLTWGRNSSWARDLELGDKVTIEGRIQSRKFTKSGDPEPNTRTAYEVSIARISLRD